MSRELLPLNERCGKTETTAYKMSFAPQKDAKVPVPVKTLFAIGSGICLATAWGCSGTGHVAGPDDGGRDAATASSSSGGSSSSDASDALSGDAGSAETTPGASPDGSLDGGSTDAASGADAPFDSRMDALGCVPSSQQCADAASGPARPRGSGAILGRASRGGARAAPASERRPPPPAAPTGAPGSPTAATAARAAARASTFPVGRSTKRMRTTVAAPRGRLPRPPWVASGWTSIWSRSRASVSSGRLVERVPPAPVLWKARTPQWWAWSRRRHDWRLRVGLERIGRRQHSSHPESSRCVVQLHVDDVARRQRELTDDVHDLVRGLCLLHLGRRILAERHRAEIRASRRE